MVQIGKEGSKYLNIASSAVADAMMVVQVTLVSDVLDNPVKYFREKEDEVEAWKRILEQKTKDRCAEACGVVLTYLGNKHRDLFDGMAILEDIEGRRPLYPSFSMRTFHQNFLVVDKAGWWYAGSPANYTRDNKNNRLTRLISSKSLQKVLNTIQRQDGGLWPTMDFIQTTFREHEYRLPKPWEKDPNRLVSLKILRLNPRTHNSDQRANPLLLFPFLKGKVIVDN